MRGLALIFDTRGMYDTNMLFTFTNAHLRFRHYMNTIFRKG